MFIFVDFTIHISKISSFLASLFIFSLVCSITHSFISLCNTTEMAVDSDTVLDITGKRDPVFALLSARRGRANIFNRTLQSSHDKIFQNSKKLLKKIYDK